MLALPDLPQDRIGTQACARQIRIVERVDGREAIVEHVDDADHAQRAIFAELDQAAVDMTLQEEARVLVAAVLIHAATLMAHCLVALVELKVFLTVDHRARMRYQPGVALQRTALVAAGTKIFHHHPHRLALAAGFAMRPVGEHAAAAKAGAHQFVVGLLIDQVRGCGDLRTRNPPRQIGTAIGRRCVELQ